MQRRRVTPAQNNSSASRSRSRSGSIDSASRSPSASPRAGRRMGLRRVVEKDEYRPITTKASKEERGPEPTSQADCPPGTTFRRASVNKSGTRLRAVCAKTRAGTGTAKPKAKSENPKPVRGKCPPGYNFRKAHQVRTSKGELQDRPATCTAERAKGPSKDDLNKAKMSDFGYNVKNDNIEDRVAGLDEALAKMAKMGTGYPMMVLQKMEAVKKEKGNVRSTAVEQRINDDINVLVALTPLQNVGGYALSDDDDERAKSLSTLVEFMGKDNLVADLDALSNSVSGSELVGVVNDDIAYVTDDL